MVKNRNKDDELSLVERPLNLELKCLDCKRAYQYKINEVVIDPDNRAEPQITDTIVCKNCGSVNNYEITYMGMAVIAITANMMVDLMEAGEIEDPMLFPVKIMKMRFMENRPISSIKEAMEEYKKALEKNPHDPGLRIGYGNMLRRQGMLREAESHYLEAARLEPNAVEAYTQLGEIAENRGALRAAHDFYAQALRRMPDARYFKTSDVEAFKQIVVERHHYLGELAKTGAREKLIEDVVRIEPQRKKVGRNEPCPCGSGKKYKKCCLVKDEAASHRTAVTPLESSLTDRLLAFASQHRFRKDFEDAYSLYFKKNFSEPLDMDDGQQIEFGAFLEWYIHDFLLNNGKTLIEEFYQENFRRLSGEERNIIESEMPSYLNVYEVAGVIPEQGVVLKDLIAGEETEVMDVKGSRTLVKWDIVITRIIRHEKANKLAGLVTMLPRDDKDRFMAALSAKWEEFKKETGKEEWKAFMKTRGFLLYHAWRERVVSTPVPFTEEHHPVIDARAEFDALDFSEIRRLLSHEFDFVLEEEKEGKELQYTWLKRGKSENWGKVPLPEVEGIRPLVIQSNMLLLDGKLKFDVLGTVKVVPERLTIECISRERLERGKARLQEVMGNNIRHRRDIVKNLDTSGSKGGRKQRDTGKGISGEREIAAMTHYYSQYVEEWMDTPIPVLGGLSPLESCKTEAGRAKVNELLKNMENHEERKRKDGQPYFDVGKIRERLKGKI